MRTVVVATFSLSAFLFILSYISRDEGYFWMVFMGIGIVLVEAGIYLAARDATK